MAFAVKIILRAGNIGAHTNMGDRPLSDTRFSWIPALRWMRAYSAQNIRVDLIAGLSLAAFVIPESLAYASLAQLPPVTGLYCYLVAGIAYALLGTSRQLAVGPTSSLAIVIATSVVTMADGDVARAMALAGAVALMVGIVSIAGRYVGLANAAYFISDPILIGFKTGAALYIASTQLPKLFGIAGVSGNFFERVLHVVSSLPQTHILSLIVGLAAIALFIAFERTFPGRPIALACFLLAYGESISVARSFAQKHGYDINPEEELTAIGTANVATGLTSGFPVAGGMSQTAVNDLGGASSPAALLVTSAAMALTLLFFARFFHNLPEPVLAAIVLMAASHLVKIDDLRRLRLASLREFRIALLAFFGVLLFGLLDGLLLAAAGSLVMLIAHAARPSVALLGREPLTGEFVNRARYPNARDPLGAIVIRSPGAWLYFNAEHIRRSILDLAANAPDGTRLLVIDCSIVPRIDTTAGTTLRVLARSLKARGIRIALAGLRDDVLENLKAVNAEEDLGPISPRRSIEDCLKQSLRSDS